MLKDLNIEDFLERMGEQLDRICQKGLEIDGSLEG